MIDSAAQVSSVLIDLRKSSFGNAAGGETEGPRGAWKETAGRVFAGSLDSANLSLGSGRLLIPRRLGIGLVDEGVLRGDDLGLEVNDSGSLKP